MEIHRFRKLAMHIAGRFSFWYCDSCVIRLVRRGFLPHFIFVAFAAFPVLLTVWILRGHRASPLITYMKLHLSLAKKTLYGFISGEALPVLPPSTETKAPWGEWCLWRPFFFRMIVAVVEVGVVRFSFYMIVSCSPFLIGSCGLF